MTQPQLSVIVIVYSMSRQAMNTLYTLSARYQRDITDREYEVIVVENDSPDPLDRDEVLALGPQFRYLHRQEPGVSPAPAINDGLREARGEYVGLLVDGARMVTPRMLRSALDVWKMDQDALVATLGWHLGPDNHHDADATFTSAEEVVLLDGLPQTGDGYDLFEMSCLSPANPHGCCHPMMESNAMFVHRRHLHTIGGADERFDLRGGGMVNLDMYRELAELPDTSLWLLPGEASFHQLHGGVTTQPDADREALMASFQAQYEQIRGRRYRSPIQEPNYFGVIPAQALPFISYSAARGTDRFEVRSAADEPVWDPEVTYPRAAPRALSEFIARQGQLKGLELTPRRFAPEVIIELPETRGRKHRVKERIREWVSSYRRQ